MIQNDQERKIVEGQLRELEKRLEKVEKRQPYPNQKYSRASLKKMIMVKSINKQTFANSLGLPEVSKVPLIRGI